MKKKISNCFAEDAIPPSLASKPNSEPIIGGSLSVLDSLGRSYVQAGGALKHDGGKPDLSQVSLELVTLLAQVRMFGEKKYARDNWKKGFKVTRSLSACLRHIFRFLSGESFDPESGLSHLGHAVACLEHAVYDMSHHPENDDRYKPEVKE